MNKIGLPWSEILLILKSGPADWNVEFMAWRMPALFWGWRQNFGVPFFPHYCPGGTAMQRGRRTVIVVHTAQHCQMCKRSVWHWFLFCGCFAKCVQDPQSKTPPSNVGMVGWFLTLLCNLDFSLSENLPATAGSEEACGKLVGRCISLRVTALSIWILFFQNHATHLYSCSRKLDSRCGHEKHVLEPGPGDWSIPSLGPGLTRHSVTDNSLLTPHLIASARGETLPRGQRGGRRR